MISSPMIREMSVAHQTPLSMGFSRQEYWNRLPFPSPGDLPSLGIKPASAVSPALAPNSLSLMPPANSNRPLEEKNSA